jgi:hypothetical protein
MIRAGGVQWFLFSSLIDTSRYCTWKGPLGRDEPVIERARGWDSDAHITIARCMQLRSVQKVRCRVEAWALSSHYCAKLSSCSDLWYDWWRGCCFASSPGVAVEQICGAVPSLCTALWSRQRTNGGGACWFPMQQLIKLRTCYLHVQKSEWR